MSRFCTFFDFYHSFNKVIVFLLFIFKPFYLLNKWCEFNKNKKLYLPLNLIPIAKPPINIPAERTLTTITSINSILIVILAQNIQNGQIGLGLGVNIILISGRLPKSLINKKLVGWAYLPNKNLKTDKLDLARW